MTHQNAAPLLRLPGLLQETQLSKSTIYRLIDSGNFPAPVKISHKCVAWRREDIQAWRASLSQTIH